MKKTHIILIAILAIILLFIFIKPETKNPKLISFCNGSLEQLRVENSIEFLKLYDKVKYNNSTTITTNCRGLPDLKECIEYQEKFLENANCMAEFLKVSDLSDTELERLRRIIAI